jgi:anti-sigma B factor antagonist
MPARDGCGPAEAKAHIMDLTVEKHADGVAELHLKGRLDTMGTGAVELQFNVATGAHRAVIVNLSGVEYLTSLGVRLLLQGAKTVRAKGGKLALLQPRELVLNVLKTAGIEPLIPTFQDRSAALAAVSA